jgi:hypothetical protein
MNGFILLTKLFELNQLPSAVLIEGPVKVSEKLVNDMIAKWFCHTHRICGSCQGCLLFKDAEHPDLHYIKPHQPGHAIKIEQIRELNQVVIQTPLILPFQLVVLACADTMNSYASNALLKTLEEPSLNVHFILLAENARLLPKTILSRCWQLKYEQELSLDRLAINQNELDDNKIQLIHKVDDIKLNILKYLQDQGDLIGCLKLFASYSIDDSLWALQFITQDIIQEQLKLKPISSIGLIAALPMQLWWKFWDKILVLRRQIKTQTSLQGSLILSDLFLTLKGY